LDKTIKIWNSSNEWSLIGTLTNGLNPSYKLLVFSNELLVSSSKYHLNIWNYEKMLLNKTLIEPNGIYSILVIRNNQLVVGSHKTINIWDVNEGKCLKRINAHENIIYALASLKNGDFASGSATNIKIWDMSELKEKQNLNLIYYVDRFVVLDNNDLGSIYFNEYLEVRNPSNSKLKASFYFTINKIQSSLVLRDNILVLGLIDGSIEFFQLNY
jgi:WD40 repeat protein